MIRADGLRRRFGAIEAVAGVSFEVPRGAICGLVGQNGAGKTTLVRILATLLAPDAGHASVDGHDVVRDAAGARGKLAYLPDGVPLPPLATVREHLTFRARAQGVAARDVAARIDDATRAVELTFALDRLIGELSRGTRQRVGLADVLLARPPVLLLDEPHAGLDPVQLRALRATLTALAAERTVLVSSHVLAEVEATATHVLVMDRGALVASGPIDEVRAGRSLEATFLAAVEAAR